MKQQHRNISGTCLIFPVKLSVKVERPFLRSSQVLLIEIMHVIYETSKRTALQFLRFDCSVRYFVITDFTF